MRAQSYPRYLYPGFCFNSLFKSRHLCGIGKTVVNPVNSFSRGVLWSNSHGRSIKIDFSKVSKEVSDLFNEISDLNYLFLRLQFIYQVQLYERESVIIF